MIKINSVRDEVLEFAQLLGESQVLYGRGSGVELTTQELQLQIDAFLRDDSEAHFTVVEGDDTTVYVELTRSNGYYLMQSTKQP